MKKSISIFTLASILVVTTPSFSKPCSIDPVPAATLLLPYFEVSLDDPNEVNTLLSVSNALPEPTVIQVTLWGDWALPSISFNIFLTGYDVVTINLGLLFTTGTLPITAHSTNDQGQFSTGNVSDAISPHGTNPAWDSAPDNQEGRLFPGCDTNLPLDGGSGLPVLEAEILSSIQAGHTGKPHANFGGGCIGQSNSDNIARGYITIDNVSDCSLLNVYHDGYFGSGIISDVNQLWGDYFIVNREDGFAFGENLVHIEAAPGAFEPGDPTFYGRYVDGLATDNREPLGSTWGARYLNGGGFDGGTDFIVWRDPKADSTAEAFACGTDGGPDWFPLDETQVLAFDEEEQVVEICQSSSCFPNATGRYPVGEASLSLPYEFGWMYMNLNQALDIGNQNDGLYGDISQSLVIGNLDSFDANLSVGYAAVQFASACSQINPLIMGNF